MTHLNDGMHFVVARHTKVATRLSTLCATVSLAAQSILGHLPIDVPQAGVVGEIVVRFQEQASWCSRLKVAGQEICDLVLGSTGEQTCLVAHLEEGTGNYGLHEVSREALRVWPSRLVTWH
jgi:hypothetical protein